MRNYWIIFIVLDNFSGGLFVQAGIPYSVASGSIGIMHVEIGIFGEQLTRSQAAERCVEYGYENLEDGRLDYIRYIALKQKLQELGTTFNGAGTAFWGDFFRLDDSSSIWYRTVECWNVTDILQLENQAEFGENCIAVKFWDGFHEVVHTAAACETYLPFICIKTNLTLPAFKVYADANLFQLPDRSIVVPGTEAGSFNECVDECKISVDCIAITYEDMNFQCNLLTIDPYLAWLSYQLKYDYGYTHAAKVGTEVTYYSATTTSVGGLPKDIPLPGCESVTSNSLSPTAAAPISPSLSSMFDRPFSSMEIPNWLTNSEVSTSSSTASISVSRMASFSDFRITPTPSSIFVPQFSSMEFSSVISNSEAPTWSYTSPVPMASGVPPAYAFNVTAYIRLTKTVELHMYEDEVTWYDALWRCSENDSRLEGARRIITPRETMMKQYLRDGNHWSDTNFTFWTGLFKPIPSKNTWYSSNITLCYEAEQPQDLPDHIGKDMQCSVAKFGGTAINDDVTVTADICSKKHPYFCLKWITDETKLFTEYNDWSYRSVPDDTLEQIDDNVTTSENCAQSCLSQWKCISWSYFYHHAKCHMLKTKKGLGHVTYELWPSFDSVTHGYKLPYNLTLHPRTSASYIDRQFQQTFPTCNMTTTTSSTAATSTSTSTLPSRLTLTSKPSTTASSNSISEPPSSFTLAPQHSETVTSASTSTTSSNFTLTPKYSTAAALTSTSTTASHFTLTPKNSTAAALTSTSSTASHFTLTSQYTTTSNSTCKRNCPCRNSTTYTATELQAVVEEIIQNLTINKATTSKARRELTSAEDSRTSAQAVGGLGIAILSCVFAGIVILDAPRILSVFWVRVK